MIGPSTVVDGLPLEERIRRRLWPICGIDPGSRYAGICVRARDDVLWHIVLDRGARSSPDRLRARRWSALIIAVIGDALEGYGAWPAVEDLVDPTSFVGKMSLRDMYDLGRVLGAIETAYPYSIAVRPAHHGQGPLVMYPPAIVGPRETTGTGGKLRHARSAYDVAGVAHNPLSEYVG